MSIDQPIRDGADPLALAPHPATPCAAAIAITGRAVRTADGHLVLTFVLTGPLHELRLPPAGPPTRGAGLWRRTCCEVFIARDDADPAYHELNLSPAREWDLHAFRDYRDGGPLADDDAASAPRLAVRRGRARLDLSATLDLGRLDPRLRTAPLRLGLAAVVEDARGALSHWALRHPAARPDFHDPAGFVLALASGAAPPYPLRP